MRKLLYLIAGICAFLFASIPLYAQQATVSGTILDETDNTPLVGVTVSNLTNNKKTKTNTAGYYTIEAAKGHKLIFTYIGYSTREASVGDDKFVNVKLLAGEKDLENVVVTAYGIKREKKGMGSSVSEVKGEDIAATRRDNFINSLAGRVPGASINSTSGAPGASTSIILRGGTSVGLSNQPLFVIDGVPLDNGTLNQDPQRDNLLTRSTANRSDDFMNRAGDINPEDIESVVILKGPEAQALYGSDGANGAIVITTKKGKTGKATITYDNSFRFEQLYRFHEVQTVYGRGRNGISNKSEANAINTDAAFSPVYFGSKYPADTPLYNNVRNFFKPGFAQQHNLTVEGGNDGMTYRFNAGYTNQDGVIPVSGFKRFTTRLTVSSKLSPKSTLITTVNYINTTVDKVSKGVGSFYMTALTWPIDDDMRNYLNANGTRKLLSPTFTNNSATGTLVSSGTTTYAQEFDNPFWDVNKNTAQDRTNRFLGNVTYNYNPASWLSFSGILSADNYTTEGYQATHPQSRFGFAGNGYFSQYDAIFRQLTGNFRTTIRKNFKSIRNTLTAGFYAEDNKRTINAFKGERFIEPDIYSINNVEPLTKDASNQQQGTRKVRLYGQYQFNWKDILIPTFSISYEGTSVLLSRIVDKSPYFTFGSGSLAFNILEIPWMKEKLRKMELFKLRSSYSTSGQTAGLLPYNIDPRFQAATSTGGGYFYSFTGNNFNLRPQLTTSFEYGLELSLFKKRLGVNLTRYDNKTINQIFFPRVSYGAGFILKYINGGDIQNKGFELQLTGSPVRKKDWGWDMTFNFDMFRNKVLKLNAGPGGYYDSDSWVYGNLRTQTSVGRSIYSLYGTAYERNINGQLIISPTTGLPITTAATSSDGLFVPVGDRAPDFSVGIQNTFTYKELSVSFNLDLRRGGDVWNGTEFALYRNGLSVRTLDRETPRVIAGVLNDGLQNSATPTPNNIVIVPYFRNDYYQNTAATSAGVVEADFIEKDINWIRMRDITFSYRFSGNLTKKLRIKSASFFVTATDLFMITNYSGADPSVNTNNTSVGGIGGIGIDYGVIASPRAVNTGIRFSF
jgi:ferric enterobactin receptor